MAGEERKTSTAEDLSRKLDLVMKRLDAIEDIISENPDYAEIANYLRLARTTVGFYDDPLKMLAASKQARVPKSTVGVQARLTLSKTKANVGEDFGLSIELVNTGKAPALLARIEKALPQGFEFISKPDYCRFADDGLSLNGRRLDPLATEQIRLVLRSFRKGTSEIRPTIAWVDESGRQLLSKPESVTVTILETFLPNRVSTGFRELDSLLLGGIPENYAVVLTSTSCDERNLLVKRFLETGLRRSQVTFYVTANVSSAKALAENHPQNIHLFICNPWADTIKKSSPNVAVLKGVESLTDIDIALVSAFRRLGTKARSPRRMCIEIISDVLLQHGSLHTRRWLSRLVPELKSQGFTTLALMNSQMHAPEEVHAILDLFDGELSIYEMETERGPSRFLRIRKMHSQRYLESELGLRKEELRTSKFT